MRPVLRVVFLMGLHVLAACRGQVATPGARTAPDAGPPDPRPVAVRGAGSTLARLMAQAWTQAYSAGRSTRIEYRATGSGEGVRALLAGEVDFALSEAPLTAADLSKAGPNTLQIPVTSSGLAIVYNLPGHRGPLRLSPHDLADIYTGKLTRWNDARLLEVNPRLPDLPILVVHRAGHTGSTAVLHSFLDRSVEWSSRMGKPTVSVMQVRWEGRFPAAGTLNLVSFVSAIPGSVGYAGSAEAARARMSVALMRSWESDYIGPTQFAVGRAAAAMSPEGEEPKFDLSSARDDLAYPLATYTFALVRSKPGMEATTQFLKWVLTGGQALAREQSFVPLLPTVSRWGLRALASRARGLE